MKRICVVAAIGACLMLSAGAAGGGFNDREFSALAKRVSKLEKETTAQKNTIASIEKTLSELRKDAATANKDLQAASDRSDTRTLLLAEWLEDYHPHKGRGRFHRDEIARRK